MVLAVFNTTCWPVAFLWAAGLAGLWKSDSPLSLGLAQGKLGHQPLWWPERNTSSTLTLSFKVVIWACYIPEHLSRDFLSNLGNPSSHTPTAHSKPDCVESSLIFGPFWGLPSNWQMFFNHHPKPQTWALFSKIQAPGTSMWWFHGNCFTSLQYSNDEGAYLAPNPLRLHHFHGCDLWFRDNTHCL